MTRLTVEDLTGGPFVIQPSTSTTRRSLPTTEPPALVLLIQLVMGGSTQRLITTGRPLIIVGPLLPAMMLLLGHRQQPRRCLMSRVMSTGTLSISTRLGTASTAGRSTRSQRGASIRQIPVYPLASPSARLPQASDRASRSPGPLREVLLRTHSTGCSAMEPGQETLSRTPTQPPDPSSSS